MDNLVTPKEYAEMHGLSASYVYRLLQQGRIEGAQRKGGRWLVPADAAILANHAEEYAPELGGPRVVTFFNFAGGVGKTTLARDLGAELARRGYRVLLIDADPQANLTSWLGVQKVRPEQTLRHLYQEGRLPEPIQVHGLDLIPAHLPMARLEVEIFQAPMGENRLRLALEEEAPGRWDLVLIDSPPSLSRIAAMAGVAGEGFVVPLEVSLKGLEGLELLLDLAAGYARALQKRPERFVKLIIPTKHDPRTRVDRQVLEFVDRLAKRGFAVTEPIGYRPGIHKRSAAMAVPIPLLEPSSPAAREIREVANRLLSVLEEEHVSVSP